MLRKINFKLWCFFLLCLALGILCEQCFFHDRLGLSFPIFVLLFYGVFMWRFRKSHFHHRRIGILLMTCIYALSITYLFYDDLLFYLLNIIILPSLVVCHCSLLVSPKELAWHRLQFISYVFLKLKRLFSVNFQLFSIVTKQIKKRVNDRNYELIKKITIGVAISFPLLLVILALLVSADAIFGEWISSFPNWFAQLNITETLARLIIILLTTFSFFGFFQGLSKKERLPAPRPVVETKGDKVIMLTVLILINIIYALFTVVQFRYFFSGELTAGLTYAEYARHGFMQLMAVTMINLVILIIVIRLTKTIANIKSIQVLLSLTIAFSGIMLWSAFKRLLLYEDAYGFTVTRMLVHAFMLFLIVIFAYTLVKIWIRRLSLAHFYITSTIIFYTTLNLVHINHWVVNENLDRYEQTGKVDIDYLNRLSYTGVLGLIDLYKKNPDIPRLANLLALRKDEVEKGHTSWQSFNLLQVKTIDALKSLELPKSGQ